MILLNGAESRELDRLSQEKYGIDSYSLMRRAGEAVADLMLRRWSRALDTSVLVVAGKGNNGGDGLVAARKLKQAGVRVEVILLAHAGEMRGDAARAHGDYVAAGGALAEVVDSGAIARAICLEKPAAVVDAIFGIGLNGEVRGLAREAIEAINSLDVPVVAVDIASGINADTGAVMGVAIEAGLTVTFGYAKYGQVSYPGAGFTGELEIADIGFAPGAIREIAPSGRMFEASDATPLLKPRADNSHKGTYGHTLIVAGSRGKSGAAILAARGALRMGAGLVTAAIPQSIAAIVAAGQPELMTAPMADREGHFAGAPAIDELRPLVAVMNALVAGPGIGVSDDTRDLVTWLVEEGAQPNRPLLIDADGLNVIAALGPALLKTAPGPIVLTPHPGEMARLLRTSAAAVNADRIGAARRLAEISGAGVLLKGARTVIATAEGGVTINSSGNPGMATPGMGDVLSGMIGALLGQGCAPGDALALAAFVHGWTADRAGQGGSVGYLAGDLAADLPRAISSLQETNDRL